MAACDHCKLDMKLSATRTCVEVPVVSKRAGSKPPLPYAGDRERCHDCNVERGGFHHPGCDDEKCPHCGQQVISCLCTEPDEEDELDD
jgi:hypothetical protein